MLQNVKKKINSLNVFSYLCYQIRTEQNKSNLQNFKTANFWVYTYHDNVMPRLQLSYVVHSGTTWDMKIRQLWFLDYILYRSGQIIIIIKKNSSFFAFYFPSNFPSFPGIPDENHSSVECLIFRGLIWRIFMWFCWLAFSVSVLVSL